VTESREDPTDDPSVDAEPAPQMVHGGTDNAFLRQLAIAEGHDPAMRSG